MKRVALCLILLSMVLALFADDPIYGSPIRFSLLEGLDYELNLTLGTNVGRLYANVNFTVNKQDLPETDYYSFFLNSGARVEHLQLNGVESQYFLCSNLHPKHFIPELIHSDLIAEGNDINCYAIAKDRLASLPDSINIYLEYRLPLPEYEIIQGDKEAIKLGEIPFFYPRNLSASSEVNINILTSIYHDTERSLKVEDTGGIRQIETFFVDIPDIDIDLNIYKLN